MSRRGFLTPGRTSYTCELCGERIVHDVVRVDEGRIYHMSCFSRHMSQGRSELRECPACRTLGAQWSLDLSQWRECDECCGTGYVTTTEPLRSSRGSDVELAGC